MSDEEMVRDGLTAEDRELIQENIKREEYESMAKSNISKPGDLSDIFKERKQVDKEDDDDDFIVGNIEEEHEDLFYEIFGDGSEYSEFPEEDQNIVEKKKEETKDLTIERPFYMKEIDIHFASKWIHNKLADDHLSLETISKIISFMKIEHLEVPFIENNLKAELNGVKDIWRIYDLCKEFSSLEALSIINNIDLSESDPKTTILDLEDLIAQKKAKSVFFSTLLNPEQLADNLEKGLKINIPTDDLSCTFTSMNKKTAAKEISCNIRILSYCRETLLPNAIIKTSKEEFIFDEVCPLDYLSVCKEQEAQIVLQDKKLEELLKENYNSWEPSVNKIREEIIHLAVQLIVKKISQRIHTNKITEGIKMVGKDFMHRLVQKMLVAPYKFANAHNRLCIAMLGKELNNIIFFIIDQKGTIIHSEEFPNKNFEEIQSNIIKYNLEYIGVSGRSPHVRNIYRTVNNAIYDRPELKVTVEYVENEIALLKTEFLEEEEEKLFEFAGSLARYVINPIYEIASCGKRITDLNISHLQNHVHKESLWIYAERAFMNVINIYGIDPNVASKSKTIADCLQYISGLGPISSKILIEIVKKSPLTSKSDLNKYFDCSIVRNCSSSLLLNPNTVSNQLKDRISILDTLRISPDYYELTKDIARYIMGPTDVEDCPVSNALRFPNKIINFSPEEYIETTPIKSSDPIFLLNEIKDILIRFMDSNYNPFASISKRRVLEPIRLFNMLTVDIDIPIVPGEIVNALIKSVSERYLLCSISKGLIGIIPEEYTDIPREKPFESVYSQSMVLKCKIMTVDKENFRVTLSCRNEDLTVRKERETKPVYQKRNSQSPFFKNIAYQDCLEYLKDKEPGEMLIRPGSRGPTKLVLSMKVTPSIISHIDVSEADKQTDYSIGKTLIIGNKHLSSIDEVIHYGENVFKQAKNLTKHSKYIELMAGRSDKIECELILTAQRKKNPRTAPYILTLSRDYPGLGILAFLLRSSVLEYIKILDNGYQFSGSFFAKLDDLINWFKSRK
eukprot:GHVP01040030.1.p1 GENE.GHVP01040030.1~~GHVP01040030.1.p1  ORF type:complete len:1018 (+),score=189.30 GHVP01040030.1:3-3056(+)